MKKLLFASLPVLLLFAVPAAAWQPLLLPGKAYPCDESMPIIEPAAVWYGWGGTIGIMAPVPPPPPPWGPNACGVLPLPLPIMPPSPKPPDTPKGPAVPDR